MSLTCVSSLFEASRIFSGLRSRCAMPLACRYRSASRSRRVTSRARSSGYGPRLTTRSKSSPPCSCSTTRYSTYSVSTALCSLTRRGWSTDCISCTSRAIAASSTFPSGLIMCLIATTSPVALSTAVRTLPNLPLPSVLPTRYPWSCGQSKDWRREGPPKNERMGVRLAGEDSGDVSRYGAGMASCRRCRAQGNSSSSGSGGRQARRRRQCRVPHTCRIG
eukprot:scaffold112664_cov72-Phaeocystis_antarctica.AAC.1